MDGSPTRSPNVAVKNSFRKTETESPRTLAKRSESPKRQRPNAGEAEQKRGKKQNQSVSPPKVNPKLSLSKRPVEYRPLQLNLESIKTVNMEHEQSLALLPDLNSADGLS